ncbi:hypothetical protein KCU81_g531, partial [Aureobasidium melanogenum]
LSSIPSSKLGVSRSLRDRTPLNGFSNTLKGTVGGSQLPTNTYRMVSRDTQTSRQRRLTFVGRSSRVPCPLALLRHNLDCQRAIFGLCSCSAKADMPHISSRIHSPARWTPTRTVSSDLTAGAVYDGDEADEGQAKTSAVRTESVVAAAMAEVAHSRAASRLVAPVKRILLTTLRVLDWELDVLADAMSRPEESGPKGAESGRNWTLTFSNVTVNPIGEASPSHDLPRAPEAIISCGDTVLEGFTLPYELAWQKQLNRRECVIRIDIPKLPKISATPSLLPVLLLNWYQSI